MSNTNGVKVNRLWKYRVLLSKSAKEIVKTKFNELLFEVAQKENIKIVYYPDTILLSKSQSSYAKHNNEIVGLYTYLQNKKTNEFIVNDEYPKISLTENYNVFVFAHELGHHYAVTHENDTSEKRANAYISILANKLLTNLERFILHLEIGAHSELEIKLPKIKRKEWRQFLKDHNLKRKK